MAGDRKEGKDERWRGGEEEEREKSKGRVKDRDKDRGM
jgi:hypothetical protein